MEDILDLYELSYDRNRPVVCFDERPCQLLADVLAPIAMKPGSAKKLDEHYQRKGTCTVLMACEPLKGFRIVETKQRRTKQDYALFLKDLSDDHYPDAEKILLVQDNLNTHGAGSFYETFDAETARRLTRRYEFHYTPKKASWLNMAEIELSALSKQCLDRRIADMQRLANEADIWASKRNQERAKIEWRFTTNKARKKLERHYADVKN
jgi:hypothetical protein